MYPSFNLPAIISESISLEITGSLILNETKNNQSNESTTKNEDKEQSMKKLTGISQFYKPIYNILGEINLNSIEASLLL